LSSTTMEIFLNVHRPTWAACSENRASTLSESGSTWSFNHTWKLSISTTATTISGPQLSYCPRYPQPLTPRRLRSRCRRAWDLVCRAVLQENVTEANNHGPTNPSKDRDESVGTWEIFLRSSISQEALETAGDDDPVKWIAEEGIQIQVSKDLFHRGIF